MQEPVQSTPDFSFDNKALRKMLVPLFLEQLLLLLVGIADTLVISYAGESAVSGVSLVNQFNTVFILLFTALASGGAVVVSQYIGRQDTEKAGEAASQLLLFSGLFSGLLATGVLLGGRALLRLLFGRVGGRGHSGLRHLPARLRLFLPRPGCL